MKLLLPMQYQKCHFIQSELALKEVRQVLTELNPRFPSELSPNFTGVCWDSRAVIPGGIFVALKGRATDGASYIEAALAGGAACAISEDRCGERVIGVGDAHKALALLSGLALKHPQNSMTLVGVTGTNGKTTTNWLVYYLLRSLTGNALRIGTLGAEAYCGSNAVVSIEETLTTPAAPELFSIFRAAVQGGVKSGVLEVSSHALAQERAFGIPFQVGIFTNLTRDHLDYHGDMESYFQSKLKLFDLVNKESGVALIRSDSDYGRRAIEFVRALGGVTGYLYGTGPECDLRAVEVHQSTTGMKFEVHEKAGFMGGAASRVLLESALIGEHNIENLLAAFGAMRALGFSADSVAKAIKGVPQVSGRLELIGDGSLPVYVDYAHTPDALERALKTLRPLVQGRLWVVFGCGGDRDPGKRPIMGGIATRLADCAVVTSDNPRTESPTDIIQQIVGGAEREPIYVNPDRAKAIEFAINGLQSGDLLLIAGKGHEQYQIIGQEKREFSDQNLVRDLFARRAAI